MPEADKSWGGESLADMVKRVVAMVWGWPKVVGGVLLSKEHLYYALRERIMAT
jgi:hypothetical protein